MSGLLSTTTSLAPPAPAIIQFNEIPYTWRVPGNYAEIKGVLNGNAVMDWPAYGLLMGQMYVAGGPNPNVPNVGTATPGATYRVNSIAQGNALFGTGSQLAKTIVRWLKANPYTPVDAIGIADAPGSVKAVGGITIAGTATAAGTLAFGVGGVRVTVGVNAGDAAATVAANLYAALLQQAQPGFIPLPSLVASYTAGQANVVLTCGHGGTLGNRINVRPNPAITDITPPGLTVTIAAMANGATDPQATVAAALAGISAWYTDIGFPWTDPTNLATFESFLTGVYAAMVNKDAQGYVAVSASYGAALAFLPNCRFLTPLPMQNPLIPDWEIMGAFAGACCYQTAQQPALQLRGVVLPGIPAPAAADIFTPNEQEQLLLAGSSTYTADSSGAVYLQRATTSYRFDPGGVPNNIYFDLSATKVPSRVRYDWNNFIGRMYPRNLLAQDGSLAANYNPAVVTPGLLKAAWAGRCAVYEQNGWIQNSAVTAAQSSFAIDPNDGNRVNARLVIQVMGNLIVLAASLEFSTATNRGRARAAPRNPSASSA